METIIKIIRGLIHDPLLKDGLDTEEYLSDSNFHISEPFVVESTISVKVNGSTISTWTFDSDTNQVTITSSLSSGDLVEIRYHYYVKHSDEGIIAGVQASFPYFVKQQYPKVFELDSSNEVTVCNGLKPTKSEKYLIALIASVILDPSLNITTPDFSFRSNDNKTTDQKIGTIFKSASRAIGAIEFIDEDCP